MSADDLAGLAAHSNGEIFTDADRLAFTTPEPPPVQGEAAGPEVTPSLIQWLRSIPAEYLDEWSKGFCVGAVEARSDFGRGKYHTALRRDDGRDTPKEAAQELADWLQYAHKITMQAEAGKVGIEDLDRFVRLNDPLMKAAWVLYIQILGLRHKATLGALGETFARNRRERDRT